MKVNVVNANLNINLKTLSCVNLNNFIQSNAKLLHIMSVTGAFQRVTRPLDGALCVTFGKYGTEFEGSEIIVKTKK